MEDTVPTSLLSKTGVEGVLTYAPFITQSGESSTLRKKVGKVKMHPELSLVKLYPLRLQSNVQILMDIKG
jgi:hypothetical protein